MNILNKNDDDSLKYDKHATSYYYYCLSTLRIGTNVPPNYSLYTQVEICAT